MVASWAVVLSALVYLCLLFAVAHWGDLSGRPHHAGARAIDDLRAGARGLLHVLDLLRLGRPREPVRARLPDHLYRPDPRSSASGHALVAPGGAPRQGAEHHLRGRLRRRPLRQERARRGLVSLIAVVGSVPYIALQLKAVSASLGRVPGSHGPPRPSAARCRSSATSPSWSSGVLAGFAVAFGTRHTDATEHQDGLDARDLARIRRQARRFPVGRALRHVLDVRRVSTDWRGRLAGKQPRLLDRVPHVRYRQHPDAHPALGLRVAAAAAAVPHDGGREQGRRGRPAGRLAVPALSRPHQPVRRSRSRSAASPPSRKARSTGT